MSYPVLPRLAVGWLAAASAAGLAADDILWILEPNVSALALSERGATLTSTDTMSWPDGRSVQTSYWLDLDDAVYRCAELYAPDATSASCWRREVAVADPAAAEGGVHRRYSTGPRSPRPYYYYERPYPRAWAFSPQVWVPADPRDGRPPAAPDAPPP